MPDSPAPGTAPEKATATTAGNGAGSATSGGDPATKSMDDIVALCKRRGFVYPASEIYGGINGFWDYGPLGVQLKNNIRDAWWRAMVECPPLHPQTNEPLDLVGLDSSIIQNPKVWEASGHVGGFNDPMVDCKETKKRYRADHLFVRLYSQGHQVVGGVSVEATSREGARDALQEYEKSRSWTKRIEDALNVRPWVGFTGSANVFKEATFDQLPPDERSLVVGPDARARGTLTEPRQFNLMFETYVGALQSEESKAYLRPETAQGIFLNFKNVLDTMRVKVPFGIAQVGKSFRNEVTPRNYIFRSREFEQMEIEWFCHPDEAAMWYEFWKDQRMQWWRSLGVASDALRLRDHEPDELAHYSKMCVDIEYRYPFTAPGFGELEGIAHRGCFDLTQHQEHSRQKLDYFDQELQVKLQNEGVDKEEIRKRSRYLPTVIEPASGLTRGLLVLLCEAYTPTPDRQGSECVLSFDPKMAPIKAGVFPLVNKDGMPEVAHKLYMDLRQRYTCEMDPKQSIGKRYARMDEVGTPYCFTVDGQTLSDQTVTVRDRDTASQQRINIGQVEAFLAEKIGR